MQQSFSNEPEHLDLQILPLDDAINFKMNSIFTYCQIWNVEYIEDCMGHGIYYENV